MDLRERSWYDLCEGESGFEQIRSRLAFLKREAYQLKPQEIDYEVGIIKELVSIISNKPTRDIWEEIVNKKLENILS